MSTTNSKKAAARLIAQHEAIVKKPPPAPRGERGRFEQRGSGVQKINDQLRRAMGHVVEADGPGAPAPAGSRARPLSGGGARACVRRASADVGRDLREHRPTDPAQPMSDDIRSALAEMADDTQAELDRALAHHEAVVELRDSALVRR